MSTKPTQVFISHSRDDDTLARDVRNLIEERLNARVFRDEEVSAGQNWSAILRKAIRDADVFIAVLSPRSVKSSWVLQEMGAAWALQKPILAVVARRDILNSIPIASFERDNSVLVLQEVDTPESAEKFLAAFEEVTSRSLITAR